MNRRPVIRLLAAAALAACVALPARADDKSDAVLKAAFKKLGDAKTMTADITCVIKVEVLPQPIELKGTIVAMKPNFLRVEVKGEVPGVGEIQQVFAADGKDYYSYNRSANVCLKAKLDAKPKEFLGMWEAEIDAFFGGEESASKLETSSSGVEKVGDVECDIVKVQTKFPDGLPRTLTYAIGKKDPIILRASFGGPGEGQREAQTNTLKNVKFGVEKEKKDFAYEPPKGVRVITPPSPPQSDKDK